MSAAPEDFRERLRRLRRDDQRLGRDDQRLRRDDQRLGRDDEPAAEAARAPAELPASLRRRLQRATDEPEECEGQTKTLGNPERLDECATEDGPLFARRLDFAREHRHGSWALDELQHVQHPDLTLLTGDEALADLDLSKAVFLDTETTGLSGGAGTYVFLVGLGSFTADGFELWQGFLREPAEERALLAACADRIAASSGVVSFFGKSFDRHRLEDKMKLHGVAPPFAAVPHLDLYHPLRRLYRGAYEDGRLRTMESELCGVERADDLPGSFAPAAWFDYLAQRPHLLEGVFQHNADDVLSLVTLAAHLGRSSVGERASGDPLAGDPAARAFGLARSLVAARRRDEALAFIERHTVQLNQEAPATRELAVLRAELLDKSGDREHALETWRALAAAPEDAHTPRCFARMAHWLQRAARPKDALECCRVARALLARYANDARSRRLTRELDALEGRCATSVDEGAAEA